MKSNLLMDFTVDKENNTVNVKREFAASQPQVWAAWTQPELLDQWWAPSPYRNKTKSMNFEDGGRWLYSMTGPEGDTHWACADYSSVSPKTNFKYVDAFCDSEGNITDFPKARWDVNFSSEGELTTVTISIKHDSMESLQKYIEMGFKEGFSQGLDQLDELLSKA